jgi:hypothetical protein
VLQRIAVRGSSRIQFHLRTEVASAAPGCGDLESVNRYVDPPLALRDMRPVSLI